MKKKTPNRMLKEGQVSDRETMVQDVAKETDEEVRSFYHENGVDYIERPPDINVWPCKFCGAKSKRYITDKPEFDAIPVNASHPVKFKRYRHWRCLNINCRRTFKTSEALDENKKVIPGLM